MIKKIQVYIESRLKSVLFSLKKKQTVFANKFKRPSRNPILIMGHQKTGTTAIAALLGKAIKKSVSIDPFYRTIGKEHKLPLIYKDKSLLGSYIVSNGYLYNPIIIKDPEFVFFYKELKQLYPTSKFVFIMRNPFDNIKSILDRLKIRGDVDFFDEQMYPEVLKTWDWSVLLNGALTNIKGVDIIETLALRWVYCANVYLKNKSDFILVKYEDFRINKIETINKLVLDLDETVLQDISSEMNKQFQPKGKNTYVEATDFFSKKNYETINRVCQELYSELYN